MRPCCWLQLAFLVAAVGSLFSCPLALGDRWEPAKEHWSTNDKWVLKVGFRDDKTLTLCEKTSDGLKEHWRRGYVGLLAPLWACVSNDGKYVVLRDVFHGTGDRKAIVVLGDKGSILSSYERNDFLPQDEEIRQARPTGSIFGWRDNAWFSFIDDDKQFALVTQFGIVRSFDLPTGKVLDLTEEQRAKIVDLVRQEAEAWCKSKNYGERIRGITLLGGMRVREAIPLAKSLFNDKAYTGSIKPSDKPEADIYGVQEAAALALIRLIGLESIPIIEEELSEANWYMKGVLLNVLSRFDTKGDEVVETHDYAVLMEMWERLAEHDSDEIRNRALCHFLRRDDGTYLLDHPELIESEDSSVRVAAVGLLGKIESPEALPLLRKAITDDMRYIRQSALRHLAAREPPELEEVLLPYLDDRSALIRSEVICELASRGNPAATAKLRKTIATWRTVDLDGSDKFTRRSEIETLCKFVADLKLYEAKDSLADVRSVETPLIAIPVNGALAALGDDKSLAELHQSAKTGELRDRALAIEMCRYLGDERSAALVKKAAESKQPWLRDAATKDLLRFKDRRE